MRLTELDEDVLYEIKPLSLIKDDVLYEIKPLSLRVMGSFLKEPQTRWWIRDLLKRQAEELDYERRCYPESSDIEVFQFRFNPPTYIISSRFAPAQQLVRDLDIENGADDSYYLTIFRGDEYFRYLWGSSFKIKKSITK